MSRLTDRLESKKSSSTSFISLALSMKTPTHCVARILNHLPSVGLCEDACGCQKLDAVSQRGPCADDSDLRERVVLQLDALGDGADGDDGDHFLDGVVGGADDERAVQQVHGYAMRTRVVGSPACDCTSSPTSPHTCRDWTRR